MRVWASIQLQLSPFLLLNSRSWSQLTFRPTRLCCRREVWRWHTQVWGIHKICALVSCMCIQTMWHAHSCFSTFQVLPYFYGLAQHFSIPAVSCHNTLGPAVPFALSSPVPCCFSCIFLVLVNFINPGHSGPVLPSMHCPARSHHRTIQRRWEPSGSPDLIRPTVDQIPLFSLALFSNQPPWIHWDARNSLQLV